MYINLFCNVYLLPIVANVVFKSRSAYIPPLSIIFVAMYLAIYPFTIFGYSQMVDGFNLVWAAKFLLINIIYASILHLQIYYGSRFFLPGRYRKKVYDKYVLSLPELSEYSQLYCDVCLNDLNEVEMEYMDINPDYKYKRYSKHVFIKLDCNHVFHPN